MSFEGPAFSAVLESANGMEAQLARVDAAVINNVPPRIQVAFPFSAIGIPNSGSLFHPGPLYTIVRLEVALLVLAQNRIKTRFCTINATRERLLQRHHFGAFTDPSCLPPQARMSLANSPFRSQSSRW